MNSATILLRQVHPNFYPNGELTSQAFFPFPKDDGKVSVYDNDQIDAASSYEHYTKVLNYKSSSVWGITCDEVSRNGLESISDPLENFPSHAVVDFSDRSEKDCRRLAKRLKSLALQRGCLFLPAS